jgi:hypothetical protein
MKSIKDGISITDGYPSTKDAFDAFEVFAS